MDKKVILGTFGSARSRKVGNRYSALHLKVDIKTEEQRPGEVRLSICGETYFPGARDIESGGQILDEVRALLADPAADLNRGAPAIARLLEVWERWHLNDMRAGCEHQRRAWDTSAPIVLVTYKLTPEALRKESKLRDSVLARLNAGETVAYTPEERRIATQEYRITQDERIAAPGPEYLVEKREIKTAGWVKPEEAPFGMLGKPCPTCGYKYGTAWLYEPLPADVVKFLEDF